MFAIQTDSTNTFIAEKRRYFPTQDYDLDTGHKAVMKQMRKKYDSISHITKTTFFIGVQDSFGFDTLRVRGAELSRCRDKGYTYKCWE